MSELKVAASTFPYLYSMTGLDALKHLRGMGYRDFEMMIFPPHCWPPEMSASERTEIKIWLDGEGGRIGSFCYPLLDNNINSTDKIMRDYTLDRYREAIDLSADWGCPYVVAIPGPVNSLINAPEKWMLDWFVTGMKSLVEHARGTSVRLLIENVPFTFLPSAQDMKDTVALIGPEVGVNLDVCNSAYIKEDVGDAIRLLGNLVENIHISDSGYDDFKHDRLGTGIVDPAPVATALRDIDYDKQTVLEIIADANLPSTDPDGDIKASHKILARHGWAAL